MIPYLDAEQLTADSYCVDESDKHHNERLIAKALQLYEGNTDTVTVATKGGLMRPQGNWVSNGNPEHLRQTIRESFEALGGNKPIDLWQYHAPDPDYTLEAALAPAQEAVDQGMIRYVGVSNFSLEQIKQAQDILPLVSVQNQYNPWHRDPEHNGVLDYCEAVGLTFLPYRPLRGRYKVDSVAESPILGELAQAKESSPYQIVLAWLRAKSPCIVPIPGASKVSSIQSSAESAEINLSPAEVEEIEQGISA
jgi:aryl-alcohol dehydrogenase-like predicted oxidoreductase